MVATNNQNSEEKFCLGFLRTMFKEPYRNPTKYIRHVVYHKNGKKPGNTGPLKAVYVVMLCYEKY